MENTWKTTKKQHPLVIFFGGLTLFFLIIPICKNKICLQTSKSTIWNPKPFCHVGERPPFLVSGHPEFFPHADGDLAGTWSWSRLTQNNVTSKGHESFGHSGWVFYGATSERNGIKQVPPFLRGNRWKFGRWTFYRFSSSGQTQPLFSRNDFFRFRFWGPRPASGEILEETRNPWVFLYGGKHHTPTASTSSAPKMKNFQEIGGRGPK